MKLEQVIEELKKGKKITRLEYINEGWYLSIHGTTFLCAIGDILADDWIVILDN